MQGYQLQPGDHFPIVRRVNDPADASTYYVQAVVRNAITLVTIATLNLTDQGGGFHSYDWEVPYDVSGQGLWVEVTTTFYNDSGHTDSATPFTVDSQTHLILDRMSQHFGAAGGADVDYKKIKKLLDAAIGGIKHPVMPEIPKTDLSDIIGRLEALPKALAALIPAQKAVDLSGIISQVKDVLAAIQALPAPEHVDLSPVLSGIEDIKKSDANLRVEDLLGRIKEFFTADMDAIKANYQEILTAVNALPKEFNIGITPKAPEAAVPPAPATPSAFQP